MTNANKTTGATAANDRNAGRQGNTNTDSIPTPNRPTTAPSQPNNPRPIAGTGTDTNRNSSRPGTQNDDATGGIDNAVTQGYDDRQFGKNATNPRTPSRNDNEDVDSARPEGTDDTQDMDSPPVAPTPSTAKQTGRGPKNC